MDRYDRRRRVVRLGEEQLPLHARPIRLECSQVPLQVRRQRGRSGRIVRSKLRDLGQAPRSLLQAAPRTDLFAQLIGTAQQGLRSAGVLPQAGIARATI